MTSHSQVAKSVREDKEAHQERYCPARGCLWKTAEVGPDGEYILNVDPCRKHPELNTAPAHKVIDYSGELAAAGYRVVEDGSAVVVISGEGRQSRARRYESAEIAYNTLVLVL